MLELVSNNPSKVFFGSYSALTGTYYKPEVECEFIKERLAELDGDFMLASTCKFGESGGTDKPETELFRQNSLIWAINKFQFYCGQWYAPDMRDNDYWPDLCTEILKEELKNRTYNSVKEYICSDNDLHWWDEPAMTGEENRRMCFYAMKVGEIRNFRKFRWTY